MLITVFLAWVFWLLFFWPVQALNDWIYVAMGIDPGALNEVREKNNRFRRWIYFSGAGLMLCLLVWLILIA